MKKVEIKNIIDNSTILINTRVSVTGFGATVYPDVIEHLKDTFKTQNVFLEKKGEQTNCFIVSEGKTPIQHVAVLKEIN